MFTFNAKHIRGVWGHLRSTNTEYIDEKRCTQWQQTVQCSKAKRINQSQLRRLNDMTRNMSCSQWYVLKAFGIIVWPQTHFGRSWVWCFCKERKTRPNLNRICHVLMCMGLLYQQESILQLWSDNLCFNLGLDVISGTETSGFFKWVNWINECHLELHQ